MAVLPVGIGPAGGYQIQRSLRFNSADSAYLNRTPASASNRQKFTISFWMKRSTLGGTDVFTGNNANGFLLNFRADNTFYLYDFGAATGGWQIYSAAVYRDVSAWYHIVIAIDTTQATDTNRAKIYINGVQQDLSTWTVGSGASRYPSLNANLDWNNTNPHKIGYAANYGYFNGYITEFYNVDGQQLTPSSFGQTNINTGVWEPIRYTGTYGTNGFYINFSDNSATTATTLGKDYSGNGNNWTPNNFSVAAGDGNDSLVDTPTSYGTDTGAGGEVRGNYCTLNPLTNTWSAVLTNGNLNYSFTGSSTSKSVAATIAIPTTGSWYWEATLTADENENLGIGIIKTSFAPYSYSCIGTTSNAGTGNSYGRSRSSTWNGTTNTAASAWNNTSDVIQFAYDATNGKLWFGKNNTWQSGDPAAGTSPSYSSISGEFYPVVSHDSVASRSTGCIFNFGQRPFAYTAPSGFKALCTQNLPTPTIGATSTTQAGKYFNANLYTGTGSAFTLTGVGFQPDFGWFKGRNASSNHWLHDAVRGANPGLSSNSTAAEDTTAGQLTAFASDGYDLPNDSAGYLNYNTRTMVVWSWKANGAGVSNTSGSITSTVSANTTAGFSIVTYTGNGVDGATVGHGLGVVPSMIIQKRRDGSIASWRVWHSAIYATSGVTNTLFLNTTAASGADSDNISGVSSTTFTTRGTGATNPNGNGCVAYVFAAVAGYSAFGSYTGNGSTDGPFVYTGFRPRYVMIKCSSAANFYWVVVDTVRNTYNLTTLKLDPNEAAAENAGGSGNATSNTLDILSNGFKLRTADGDTNLNATTYIYAAFAESPFKYSLAR